MIEWLNRPGPYCQYVHVDLAPWKMKRLLELYPFFFDDLFWYWHPKNRKDIIVRAPLWTYPTKSVPAEKAARNKAKSQKAQSKLL